MDPNAYEKNYGFNFNHAWHTYNPATYVADIWYSAYHVGNSNRELY